MLAGWFRPDNEWLAFLPNPSAEGVFPAVDGYFACAEPVCTVGSGKRLVCGVVPLNWIVEKEDIRVGAFVDDLVADRLCQRAHTKSRI